MAYLLIIPNIVYPGATHPQNIWGDLKPVSVYLTTN